MTARGITYFENSRRATLAQRAYCRANPGGFAGYSDSLWGITASDVPGGYNARGAPPGQNDDGTITPTAPISSLPFAPDSIMPTIRNMWNNYRAQILTPSYGFRDAFNLSTPVPWYDADVIGIDQGPIILMIENYRTGRGWNRFMKNPDVQRGLGVARFQAFTGVEPRGELPRTFGLDQNYPNPFNPGTTIRYHLSASGPVTLSVYDVLGRLVATLAEGIRAAGDHQAQFDASRLSSGVYVCRLSAEGSTRARTMILMK